MTATPQTPGWLHGGSDMTHGEIGRSLARLERGMERLNQRVRRVELLLTASVAAGATVGSGIGAALGSALGG